MKLPTPAHLSIAEMCQMEPLLFKVNAVPPVCEPLQWPELDWTGLEQAARLAA
jgi:hypothetical protein